MVHSLTCYIHFTEAFFFLLSKYQTVSRYIPKGNSFYALQIHVAFPAPTSPELSHSEHRFVRISYTETYSNRTINVVYTVINSCTPLCKVWLSQCSNYLRITRQHFIKNYYTGYSGRTFCW